MPEQELGKADPLFHALHGCCHGQVYVGEVGWFDNLFTPKYEISPYINVTQAKAHELLFKKTVLQTWAPVFAKHFEITTVLNTIIGVDLLKNDKGPGLLEDLAQILLKDEGSKTTLQSRIDNVKKSETWRLFEGIAFPIDGVSQTDTLAYRPRETGSFVSVEGIINHVDAIEPYNRAVAKTLRSVGASWAICDFPYFALGSGNKYFNPDHVCAIIIDPKVAMAFKTLPFDGNVGWYPYANVFGAYRKVSSEKAANMEGLEYAWMEMRPPIKYGSLGNLLGEMIEKTKASANGASTEKLRFPFDLGRESDVLLLLSSIQLSLVASDLEIDDDDKLRAIAKEATARLKNVPKPLAAFFKV